MRTGGNVHANTHLSSFSQMAGYSKAYVASGDAPLIVLDEFNLILVGAGNQHIVLGADVDHVVINTESNQVFLQSFQTGNEGDQLQFLGLGGLVKVHEIANGIRISSANSGQFVDLHNVAINEFNLASNLVGVTSVSFADENKAGTRSINSSALFDAQVHVNEITASNFGDTLIGGLWDSKLNGGNGNDKFIILGTNYRINGMGGNDTVSYEGVLKGVLVNLTAGADDLGSSLYQVDNLIGTTFNDHLIGNAQNNIFEAGRGQDLIEGGGGNDTYLFGRGDGADTITNGLAVNVSASSVLRLKEGVGANDLWLGRQNDDLIVNILGSEDRVQIKDWFASTYRKLGAIELANGLRLNTADIDLLVVTLNAWHQANPNFDPRHASALPLGLALLPYFTNDVVVPAVPEASNVALDVKRLYESQRAAIAAELALSTGLEISKMVDDISASNTNAQTLGSQISPIGVPPGSRLYSYQSSYEPGINRIVVTQRDFNSTNISTGRGADVTTWRQLSSLEAGRFYIVKTVASTRPGDVASTTTIEGDLGILNSAIADINAFSASIASMSSSGGVIASSASARQEALRLAMAANASSNGEHSMLAREAATDFEDKLNTAISSYQELAGFLSNSLLVLNRNKARLDSILPPTSSVSHSELSPIGTWRTVVTTTSYSFYHATDSNKFNALQSVQSLAQNSYNAAIEKIATLLSTFKSIDDFATVQFAAHAGVVTASAGGDLLIAANGGNHVLNGGVGRDTFLFANVNSSAIERVNGFQAGINGDRLFIIATNERIAYFGQDGSGYIQLSYSLGNGVRTEIQLAGVSYSNFSLYDNLLGVDTADFGGLAQGIFVDLHSVTPRDLDGYTHVRNLVGSAFADTLSGDAQDNTIFGGTGDDLISGGAGNNVLDGGTGIDTASYATSVGAVVVNLDLGTSSNGFGGADTLISIENVMGSDYADLLIGNSAANLLQGGNGNDVLRGLAGDDILIGGAGDDLLYGGAGSDILQGGSGNDTYHFSIGDGQDIIIENDNAVGKKDSIVFGAGITAQSLQLRRSGLDLLLTYGSGDVVTVQDWYVGSSRQIQETVFADGTRWNAATLIDRANNLPTLSIALSGDAVQNQLLAATATLVGGTGSLTYQWQRSSDGLQWLAIDGATNASFELTQIDVGTRLRVIAVYSDDIGNYEVVTSESSSPIANVNDAPVGNVLLDGLAAQGQILSAQVNLSDADGLGALTYQWQTSSNGDAWVNIVGATAAQFALQQSHVGTSVRVVVSYTDAYGTAESIASAASGLIENVNDLPQGGLVVIGQLAVGNVLTLSNSITDRDGLGAMNYQWQRSTDGVNWINLANGNATSYTLSNDDVGYRIRALASYTDAYGTLEQVSASATAVVTASTTPTVTRHTGTTGADNFIGGSGNDEYVVNHVLDRVVEQPNGGVDTVFASVAHTLAANVENLTLTGTAAINGTGNDLDNILIGNDGNNNLTGGLGADTMIGGKGNDIYYVDNVNDVVVELSNEGTDRIMTSVSYALPDNVENMTLQVGNFSVSGNALDNQFLAVAAGSQQTIAGGAGNDEYFINPGTSGFDKTIIEHENEGIDTVRSAGNYTLAANLEILYLLGTNGIRGTGNELNNEIYGNDYANILDGRAGNDLLVGGKGNDTYLFSAGSGLDTIVENDATAGNLDIAQWDVSHDKLWFSRTGNNLSVSVIGTNDAVIVKDWYLGNAYHVEQLKSGNGRTLSHTNVDALVQEMARFSPPPSGQTSLHPVILSNLSPVYAASWQ